MILSQHYVHDLDPVLVNLFGLPIRYYSLSYFLGLLLGWWLLAHLARRGRIALDREQVASLIIPWALFGVLIGGRLGYVLFYDLRACLVNPVRVVKIWQGGMASHGGILGVILAFWLYARRIKVPWLHVFDLGALVAPIGLCLGRIANFINGELWGRPGEVPWAVVFPAAGPEPRHPSQLYEALGEGLLLFLVLLILHRRLLPRTGSMTAIFLVGYSLARVVSEQFREPDRQIGFQALGTTRGQLLTIPVIVFGLVLAFRAWKGKTPTWEPVAPS